MGKKVYLAISGVIFGLLSLAHILRVINNWAFEIGAWNVPLWISWIVLFVSAALCVWAISLATE